jgi:hypothetical protein
MKTTVQHILLADDNVNDIELTIAARRGNRVANVVVVVRDGAEALGCLYTRGQFAGCGHREPRPDPPRLEDAEGGWIEALRQVKPVAFSAFVEAVKVLGQF